MQYNSFIFWVGGWVGWLVERPRMRSFTWAAKNPISIAITVFTRQDYERLLWIFIWIGKGKAVPFIFLSCAVFRLWPTSRLFLWGKWSNKQWKSMCSKTFAMKTFFSSLTRFVRLFVFSLLLVMSEYIFMSFMVVPTKHGYCLVVSRFIRSPCFRHRHTVHENTASTFFYPTVRLEDYQTEHTWNSYETKCIYHLHRSALDSSQRTPRAY